MAFDVIKDIVEAEKEVDNIKSRANAEAEAIRAEAKVKAAEMIAEAKKQSKLNQTQMIKSAVENSQTDVEKIIAEAARKCEDVKKSAEERRDKAVQAVIGKVVGINGYS